MPWDYVSLTNQKSPSEPSPEVGALVETVFSDPPHLLPHVTTAPIDGTFAFEVSPSAIVTIDPSVAVVTLTLPAAVVFKACRLFALPSSTASANQITCEYEAPCPAAK